MPSGWNKNEQLGIDIWSDASRSIALWKYNVMWFSGLFLSSTNYQRRLITKMINKVKSRHQFWKTVYTKSFQQIFSSFFSTKGNGYYIPNPSSQGLNVKISLQTSKYHEDKENETSARYATAWFNHGINPSDAKYEYTIVVNKPANFVQVNETTPSPLLCCVMTVLQTI